MFQCGFTMVEVKKDLSSFAAFNLDDLLSEIAAKNLDKKEVTAYLDRSFIINALEEYKKEALVNKQEFTSDKRIDFTDYNFTGADLRRFNRKDLELFNFHNCDITAAYLDRISLEYFRQYMLNGNIIFQGLNLDKAYLGPTFTRRMDLGLECYMYLSLSNLNLAGTIFTGADIEGLILENTNISGCNFTGVQNLDPKQFAFSMGFESAVFSKDKSEDQSLKNKIKELANSLDPEEYYNRLPRISSGLFYRLINFSKALDD